MAKVNASDRSFYPVFKDARAIFDERVWASVFRARSSAGRAPGLHPGGRRFDPGRVHQRSLGHTGAYSSVWLERTPDKREVGGSNPPRPTTNCREAKGIELS